VEFADESRAEFRVVMAVSILTAFVLASGRINTGMLFQIADEINRAVFVGTTGVFALAAVSIDCIGIVAFRICRVAAFIEHLAGALDIAVCVALKNAHAVPYFIKILNVVREAGAVVHTGCRPVRRIGAFKNFAAHIDTE